MTLSKKTQKAIKAKATVAKAKTVKVKAVKETTSVYAWKLVKRAGADRLLGHGGFYNLRSADTSGVIVGSIVKGAATRKVCIFAGAFGVCFADGSFVGKTLNVGGIGIDTGKIKKVLFFGSVDGAAAFVRA